MTRARLSLAAIAVVLVIGPAWYLVHGRPSPSPGPQPPAAMARPPGAGPLAGHGAATEPLELASAEARGLEIHVADPAGPVQGAAIRIYVRRALEPVTGRPGWRRVGQASSDAAGVAVAAAGTGTYLVSARTNAGQSEIARVVRPAGEPVTRVEMMLQPPHVLEGRTIEASTQEPVPQVALAVSRIPEGGFYRDELPPEERSWTVSDPRGRFRVDALAPGRYVLEAECPGHARVLQRIAIPRATSLDVAMTAAGVIEGRVIDGLGASVEGAEVTFTGGGQVLVVTTGPAGGFAAELPPLTYRVSARADRGSATLPSVRPVAAGQTVRDVVLRLGQPGTIRGEVVTGTGVPLTGAVISLSPTGEDGEVGRLVSGSDGRFAFAGLPPAAYDIDATAEGLASASRHRLLVGPGQSHDVRLFLPRDGIVVGLITDGGGRPVPGARVRAGRLLHTDGLFAEALTGKDGRYRLADVEPGPTALEARSGSTLVSLFRVVMVDAERTTVADFTLPGTGTVRGVIRSEGGQPPAKPATAMLFPTEREGRPETTGPAPVPADGDGRFTAEVPEGAWVVAAYFEGVISRSSPPKIRIDVTAGEVSTVDLLLEEEPPPFRVVEIEVREPDGGPSPFALVNASRGARSFARTDGAGRAKLELPPGVSETVMVEAENGGRTAPPEPVPAGAKQHVLVLRKGGTLRGQVLESRRPVAGATLMAMHLGAGLWLPVRRDIAAGEFTLDDLAPGEWRLVATSPDGGTGAVDVNLAPGAEVVSRIELSPGATVTGRIVDGSGAPMAGAHVSARDRDLGLEGTGTDGRFRLTAIAPGPAVAVRVSTFLGGLKRTVALEPGQTVDLGDLAPTAGEHSE